jgi:hypothetical protein
MTLYLCKGGANDNIVEYHGAGVGEDREKYYIKDINWFFSGSLFHGGGASNWGMRL